MNNLIKIALNLHTTSLIAIPLIRNIMFKIDPEVKSLGEDMFF